MVQIVSGTFASVMNKTTIISKINSIHNHPITLDEWLATVDAIFDVKTYQEFRKERHAYLKSKNIPYKDIMQQISSEWKEYKIQHKI